MVVKLRVINKRDGRLTYHLMNIVPTMRIQPTTHTAMTATSVTDVPIHSTLHSHSPSEGYLYKIMCSV